MKKNGYFEDSNGNSSSTRLMSFLAFLSSVMLALITLLAPVSDKQIGFWLTLLFLGYSLGQKIFQKILEVMEKVKTFGMIGKDKKE